MLIRWFLLLATLAAILVPSVNVAGNPLAEADRLFKDQHWAEARAAYDTAREHLADWQAPETLRAVENAVVCACKLGQHDDAIVRLEAYISHNAYTHNEITGQRYLAILYLTLAGSGETHGGQPFRGSYGGDAQKSDEREAILHLERARAVAMRIAAAQRPGAAETEHLAAEQDWIGTDFDLATALTRLAPLRGNHSLERWLGVYQPPPEPDPVDGVPYITPEVSTRNSDYDPHEPPVGIPRRPDGELRFAALPAAYDPALVPGEKFRFLLNEIERTDTSAQRDEAAKALLRRAVIAQSFYGPALAQSWGQWWESDRTFHETHRYGSEPPPPAPVPATKVWQLTDNQALVPVGGWLRVVDLPTEESPLALLAAVEARNPQTTLLPEVRYARALYHQQRQQYPRALAEYRELQRDFPKHPRAADARVQIAEIESPGVGFGATETFFPGERPTVPYTVRNAEKVQFTDRRFDLIRFKEAELAADGATDNSRNVDIFGSKGWRKYLARETVNWSETVPSGQENRPVKATTSAPLAAPGAYVIEARLPDGKTTVRVLIEVTDVLLLSKDVRDERGAATLIVACDARTGRPVPDRALRVYESWKDPDTPGRKGATHLDRQACITDAAGAVFYRRRHHGQSSHIEAAMIGNDGRVAYSNLKHLGDNGPTDDRTDTESRIGFLVTDRPVYRPGATVHFCVWLRSKRGGVYQTTTPGMVWIHIQAPRGHTAQKIAAKIDEAGIVSGEYTLGSDAALGNYSIYVGEEESDDGNLGHGWSVRENIFAVEEYRQPEFEVTVHPSTTQARLGEKFKASVEARYYFGALVTQAKVSYKVYRELFERSYFEPAEYDSLCGRGYGIVLYPYPWLSWWERWGDQIGWGNGRQEPVPSQRWNEDRYDPRELVAQGEGTLDAEGKCEVEVDTARAKAEHGGHDQQYTIEATIVSASRRAVSGSGGVVATRQGFYIFVEADHGWYHARDEVRLRVRALTPGNVPVSVRGQVVVSRLHYDGPNHDSVTEEEIERHEAETDAEGRLVYKTTLPKEGQYHVAFRARDAWNEDVQGNTVLWAQGPRFDGRAYRANELEIIPDKRSYRVGETAHLLINTAGDDARVILARSVADGVATHVQFLDLPRRSLVVDVPIDEGCVPNIFYEATVVRDGRVRVEACVLWVPPEQKLLNLSVRTDKQTYGPGEKGTVHVEATDKSGQPASGEVALTVFDKAVTAIRAESDTTPAQCFFAPNYFRPTEIGSSFDEEFSDADFVRTPDQYPDQSRLPEGWDGSWKIGAGTRFAKLRDRLGTTVASVDRVVIVGSNIPTAQEVGPPTFLDDPATVAEPAVPNADPRGRPTVHPVEPEIRTRFADTALWLPTLNLDANGKADAEVEFPQSLSTWRVHGYVVNAATQIGDATAQAITTKKLLVRLLSPRFFRERDEVVLSAAVNNYLLDAQEVTAELTIPAAQLQPVEGLPIAPDTDGNLHLTARATVTANSEHRFDWRVKTVGPGLATLTARALTTQESDGVRLAFPVEVHGVEKTLVQSGSFAGGQDGERALHIEVPAEVDLAQTRLEITLSPSLAGVMIDALPYLADYPYGCVEQTMDRFYPSVLVRGVLKKMGTDLEALGNQRRQMNPADLASRFGDSPVYDSARLERMIREGLSALYNAEHYQGGWGWWAGEEPSLAQTVYVLQGLQSAKAAGIALDDNVYNRGLSYVWQTVCAELAKPAKKQDLGNVQQQVYCAYVLSLQPLPDLANGRPEPVPPHDPAVWNRWLDRLYARRGDLNNYGRAQFALTLQHAGRDAQARTVLRNLLQFVERDDSNETAHVRTPEVGWWFWWNNDIETNAWALKAIVLLDPKNELAPRLVKWLLNNRRNGAYWRSTRDTAQAISAMLDYLLVSGEGTPDNALSVSVDGEITREVHVTRENLFAFDNKVVAGGASLKPGAHEVVICKHGAGALYYSCRLTYFTHEEGVKSARGEISVERQYFRLVPETKLVPQPTDGPTPGAVHSELRSGYQAVLLNDGDGVASGDLIEVVLKIDAKNTYDYLAFEDPKPAGCETMEVRSGQQWADGFCANVELRDKKTVFFVELLEPGEHVVRYRLRAETPGRFHALPATGTATYAPEVRANSDEMHVGIQD